MINDASCLPTIPITFVCHLTLGVCKESVQRTVVSIHARFYSQKLRQKTLRGCNGRK